MHDLRFICSGVLICSPRTQKYDAFNNEKICFFLETLYIDGIDNPDQVHYICYKILEIPPLEVFLGEFDKFGAQIPQQNV